MYKHIFFDLDGTLIGMDETRFLTLYFKTMIKHCNKYGLNGPVIADVIEDGTQDMIRNDGSDINENIFWATFERKMALKKEDVIDIFDEYYATEFPTIYESCFKKDYAVEIVKILKEKGYKLYLTTNPLFPKEATFERLRWGGLDKDDFEIITAYHNSSFCKPNPKYYDSIIKKFNLNTEEILMVGNDVYEDGIIQTLGVDCYLVSDGLLNRKNLEINSKYYSDLKGLLEFVKTLPNL